MRGVITVLTMAELQADQVRVAAVLMEEVEADFAKLGMELDSIKISKIAEPKSS